MDLDALNIFKLPKTPLYHYTSREVFWKIMDSETFYARHIMFSNDYMENEIGNEKVMSAMKELMIVPEESRALPFMICFCEKDDLLSQWRGYAKQGIAMEFDFSKGLYGGMNEGFSSYYCYTIVDEKEQGEAEHKQPEAEVETVVEAIVSPYAVIYSDEAQKEDDKIKGNIEIIREKSRMPAQQRILQMIPYIKSDKFQEEKEYRLIFDMNELVSESKHHLLEQKYKYLDVDGVRKPNILIKFSDVSKKETEEIQIYYGAENLISFMNEAKAELEKEGIAITLKKDSEKYKMKPDEIIVSEGKNQEVVCTKLRLMIYQKGPQCSNIRIWCDGHLPIRRIVVGPSQDAELMKNSIEEYLKTKYWTKDIKVEVSKIPLRL